jgi:hypothetical protein
MILSDGTDFRLDPEDKALWIADLLSDKYKQGSGRLVSVSSDGDKEHCCIGVYGERRGLLRTAKQSDDLFYDNSPDRLKGIVVAKGRLSDFDVEGCGSSPQSRISYISNKILPYEVQVKLASLNDGDEDPRKSFKQIAKWIGKNL